MSRLNPVPTLLLSACLLLASAAAAAEGARPRTLKPETFYVLEKSWNAQRGGYDYYRVARPGTERPLKADARRAMLSEDQRNYPEPESGCGPTALLNLYIWYSKFGLIRESVRHSDLQRYKQLKFDEIDRRMREIQRRSRSEAGGTNTLEQVVVMDQLLRENSASPTRLHFEVHRPPLANHRFLRLSRNFRAGILSVRPEDRASGELLPHHAVLVVRSDTTGRITVANYGGFEHGRLVEDAAGQWFQPDAPGAQRLLINHLTILIPFSPASPPTPAIPQS